MRQSINHIEINNFQEVITLINSANLFTPPIPSYTPKQDSKWYNAMTGESSSSLHSSLWCVDFETIENTKILVMGAAFDILNQEWWVMISQPGTNPRVKTEGKHIIIAHRSTFELGFYQDSYNLDCQLRFLDTHTMAAQKYHPAQVGLYRSQPWLPMFKESCDLSLAELSHKLCNRPMDKGDVEVFIDATEDNDLRKNRYKDDEWCWREPIQKISKNCKSVFSRTLKLQSKIEDSQYKTETWEELMFKICPDGFMESIKPEDLEILDKPSKKFLATKKLFWTTPIIDQLCIYNQTDVSCTMGIFTSMWEWYQDLPYEHIAGLYHRSVPFLPLTSDWFKKVKSIDNIYQERMAKMVNLVGKIEQEYLGLGQHDWDLLDWGTWGNGCKDKTKIGKVKWVGTTGLSSKKLMRIARLFWDGKPLYVKQEGRLDKEGERVIKIDGEDSQMMAWYTCDPHEKGWLEAVKLKQGEKRMDNPTNTSDNMKDIVTVFSKTFIPFWNNGKLTSESIYAKEIAETYASISFWNSFRDRVFNKMMISSNGDFLSLVLRTLVSGAISGRAIDNIGLVLSSPQKNKVGSELGGHFCCPDGYKFVFADFDSIQAVIIALYAAIAHRKYYDFTNRNLIDPLNNEFSRSVLVGEKKTKSTLAWLLAKRINPNWETDWKIPAKLESETVEQYKKRCDDIGKSEYALGKTVQYAMLFGAGIGKLIVLCGSESVARSVVSYFKGDFSKETKRYEGGIASGYFNYCKELAQGITNQNGRFRERQQLETSFLRRQLPLILKPSVRGKDLAMTAMNVVTQSIDVDCLNYVTNGIISQCVEEGIQIRYSTTVHDSLYLITRDEDTKRVKEIFQEQHYKMYMALLEEFYIDPDLFPKTGLHYSGVDINSRWTKSEGDLGKTISNLDGYDYLTTASFNKEGAEFIYGDTTGAVFADDYQSSSSLIKYFKSVEVAEELVGVDSWEN